MLMFLILSFSEIMCPLQIVHLVFKGPQNINPPIGSSTEPANSKLVLSYIAKSAQFPTLILPISSLFNAIAPPAVASHRAFLAFK